MSSSGLPDIGPREVRVLHISPSEDLSAQVQCTLHKVSLDDHERETYHALSYTWGNAEEGTEILINGSVQEVTSNLDSALRHIRNKYQPLRLWADAVCINQGDNVEKSAQVAMMADIYESAESVIVWLGEDSDDSELAMATVVEWGRPCLEKNDRYLLNLLQDGKYDKSKWDALDKLLERPYWRRRWIFQELLLGKKVNIHCGLLDTPWETFRGLEEAWYQVLRKIYFLPPNVPPQRISDSKIGNLMTFTNVEKGNPWKISHRSLFSIQLGTTMMKCSDLRDHIYALIGIADDSDQYPKPDYSKPVAAVYNDYARAHVQLSGRLDVLNEAATRNHKKKLIESIEVPSWVPDWRIEPEGVPLARQAGLYKASKGFENITVEPELNLFSPDSLSINPEGVIVDKVDYIYNAKVYNISALLCWLISGITMGIDPPHPTGFPLLNVLFKTLFLDNEYRLRVQDGVRLSEEEQSSTNIYLQLAESFMLLTCLEWGYLQDLVYPDQKPGDRAMFDLNLRFLPEGSELAKQYPKFETMKSFCDAVHEEGKLNTILLKETKENIANLIKGRKLFQTDSGFFGLASLDVSMGDIITVLHGCRAPIILREANDGFTLAGDAFIYGLMDGEAFSGIYDGTDVKISPTRRFCIY